MFARLVQIASSAANAVSTNIARVGGTAVNTQIAGEGALPVEILRAATGTRTDVPANVASVTILAANAARKGAALTNDSTQRLKLLLAAGTASATNFLVAIEPGGYYEVPFNYSGIIIGIWAAADASGNARVTEFT